MQKLSKVWFTNLYSEDGGIETRMRQVTIYREPGRYAGWPANYGIWAWDNEIVVGFTVGYHKSDAGFHRRDSDKPFTGMQGRSLDGGETWHVSETPCRLPARGTLSAMNMWKNGIDRKRKLRSIHRSASIFRTQILR